MQLKNGTSHETQSFGLINEAVGKVSLLPFKGILKSQADVSSTTS